ncbi:MAG: NAD(P)-dependent alcohol dehydrogenase [Chloroflexota bacterium]
MKAIVWTQYGSAEGLQLQEIEKPSPKNDEILVKIVATSVTAGDSEMRRLKLPLMLSWPMRLYAGVIRPRRLTVLGQELAGVVEEVGKDVQVFKKGNQVFGTTGLGFGAYAEYICLKGSPNEVQGVLAIKPANLSYEEAAVVPTAAFEALHFLRAANVQPRQKVLVFGAGGSIGTFSVQLAKHFGAEVTAVDSTNKLEMLRKLGADETIDYTKQDVTQNGESYDVIIDVVGSRLVSSRLKSLKQNGRYCLANASLSHLFLRLWLSITSQKKLLIQAADQTSANLRYLTELIEAGKLVPTVDRSYSLEQIPDAHRYADTGQKLGNIAITISGDDE